MGFTHYFPRKREITDLEWEAIGLDVSKLFAHSPVAIEGIEGWGNPPIVSWEYVRFNGKLDRCETFLLDRESQAEEYEDKSSYPYGFGFCKTRQMPYDVMVCAVLIVAHKHAPGGWDISSDGEAEDWQPALTFVQDVLGLGYSLPFSYSFA